MFIQNPQTTIQTRYYTDHLFYKKEIETTCTVFKVSFIIDLCTVTETRCSSHHFPMDGDDVASEWAIDRWHLVAIGHAIGRAGLCATGYHGAGHPLIMRGIGASKNSLTALLRVPGKRCQEFYSQG